MTINISLNQLANLQNENTAVTQINQNSTTIQGGFTTALNTTGDTMQGTLDMNSNQVINLPQPATANSPLRLQDLNAFTGGGSVTNIPPGGGIGDVLVKTSTANYVTGWSPNAAGVTAGTNIVLSGTSPVTINTNTSPSFNVITATTITASTVTAIVPAGTLSGTTLAGNVVSSSLASVGTITTGTWNATAITATSLSGVTLANNILSSSLTSLGVVTNLTSGTVTVTGSLTATGNITGLTGKVTSLTASTAIVTGNLSATGTVTSAGLTISASGSVLTAPSIWDTAGILGFTPDTSGFQWNNNANSLAIMSLSNTGALSVNSAAMTTLSASSTLTLLSGATTVAGGSTTAAARLGTLGIGIYFGSGAPTITAATGSLYLRTDGTTLTGRMYVNTTGASTWTGVNTVG